MDEIATTLTKLRADKEFFVQFAVQGPVEIDGDKATTRCFSGRYIDRSVTSKNGVPLPG